MKKTLWLLACFGILTASSCQKKQVEPTFQNTFSCKINGQLWEPNGPDGFFGFQKTLSFFFSPGETGLGIQASSKTDSQTLTISCLCKAEIGIYQMRYPSFNDYKKGCDYQKFDTLNSKILITNIDTVKRELFGTFYCKIISTGACNDTLKITDGKFQLKY